MGFRTGFVLSSCAFLFGALFIASIYDFPLLYYSPWDETAPGRAEAFYLSLHRGPSAITALLHGMMALGVLGLLAKLHRWTETAIWFDGAGLALYMGAIALYGVVTIPNLRLLSDPTNESLLKRSSLYTQRQSLLADVAKGLLKESEVVVSGPMTAEERISCVRILAATNTMIAGLLAGVVIMMASEWWIERGERIEKENAREQEMRELKLATSAKKSQ